MPCCICMLEWNHVKWPISSIINVGNTLSFQFSNLHLTFYFRAGELETLLFVDIATELAQPLPCDIISFFNYK